MNNRIAIAEVQPKALTAMLGLEGYLATTELTAELKELIKLRASMINQCAYCIEMHTKAALELGVEQQKIFALSAWKESPRFDQKEQALLQLVDEMTLIHQVGVSDATYQACIAHFGEQQTAEAMMQTITINAWNRFALATKMQH
ncbi:carboxymuconolactone decarboxylase family protein [Photobacterium sanguinicancri]|uniref:carboxymuconolactone decarboxylase family protein n=1 Tax=Photobacterium sanguinicancri TaxID=875932 RepID=UPI0026E1B3E7|nr:carboxymuconolactone decarboxylase family protein [Photobacterium sanguinicancri]MDO6500535.1 carboxymuconolactone decarboxylase family protein [Photobacterium sanguinicancri]